MGNTRLPLSQLTSPVFDAFLRDVFTPLCTGGVVSRRPRTSSILPVADVASREPRERHHSVPSVLRTLLRFRSRLSARCDLAHVLTSGEPLLPVDVQRFLARFGSHAAHQPLRAVETMVKLRIRDGGRRRTAVRVGAAIDGARHRHQRGTARCARPASQARSTSAPVSGLGYYRRPLLTDQAFVPNPFGSSPTDLVYRTRASQSRARGRQLRVSRAAITR